VRRFRKHGFTTPLRLLLVAVPAGFAAIAFAAASLAAEPTIEAVGGGPYAWSPSSAQTAPGGTVTFKNPSGSALHGVTWTGGPETPTCSNVPIDNGKTSWTGICSFTQAGTYSFYCPVHPIEMKGTIAVGSASSPSPGSPPPPGSPTDGAVATALKLAKKQRGRAVRGSIRLLRAGSGSRLVVELTASRKRLLGAGHAGKMRVGRLARSSPTSGRYRFAVSLRRVARRALRHGEALPLMTTVTVTSSDGDVFKRARAVVMRGRKSKPGGSG